MIRQKIGPRKDSEDKPDSHLSLRPEIMGQMSVFNGFMPYLWGPSSTGWSGLRFLFSIHSLMSWELHLSSLATEFTFHGSEA